MSSFLMTALLRTLRAQIKPVYLSMAKLTVPYLPIPSFLIIWKSDILNSLCFLFFYIIFFRNVGVYNLLLYGNVLLPFDTFISSPTFFSFSFNPFFSLCTPSIKLIELNSFVSVLLRSMALRKQLSTIFFFYK